MMAVQRSAASTGSGAAGSGFLLRRRSRYTGVLKISPFTRLISALVVVILLLTGFAAASVAADAPCLMPTAASMPCADEHQSGTPDDQGQGSAALACFAKCPAATLDRLIAPMGPLLVVRLFHSPPPPDALFGIGVEPPRHPPRI